MTITHKFTTIGALRDFIRDIPDDVKICITETGSGMVDDVELEINYWDNAYPDVYLNIKAENTVL